jgi:exosortase
MSFQPTPRNLFIFMLVLLGLLYINTITWLTGSWIYNSYYTHGFIVFAISVYFSYKICKKTSLRSEVDSRGLYVLSLSLIVHVLASLWDFEYISALSLLTAIYGLIIAIYGMKTARQLTFPVFFMVLAIPFPIYDLTNQLEVLSAQASVSLVNLFGIEASNVGAEIHLETCSFVVGAPCSGIRSIISLLTVAALYAYIVNDRFF